jgi:hypothetical protein
MNENHRTQQAYEKSCAAVPQEQICGMRRERMSSSQ